MSVDNDRTVPLAHAVLWLILVIIVGLVVVITTTRAAGDEPPIDCTTFVTGQPWETPPNCLPVDDDQPEPCTPGTCPPGCVDPADKIPCVWERDDHPIPPAEPAPSEPRYTG